jgi:plasmid stabilization system protein ParE
MAELSCAPPLLRLLIAQAAVTASVHPRPAAELNLPGLRSWPLKKYPHLVCYVERSDHIDVWRVPHGQRDILRRCGSPT